jgi:4-amino-4-deoxy-L-arabinose transferase-like glycosyltransferase
MPDWLHRRIPIPLPAPALALLVAAFILPGLVGHDPWKTEDAVGFGVVWQMVQDGGWLTPRLAGEPWYDDGPLYFWVAALFVKTLGALLPAHDAARFASASFILLALWFVRLASRELYGRVQGDLSALAFMGCLGLMWHAHEVAAETAMLAGLAAAYYGLAIAHKKPYKGGALFGAGVAIALLAKGLPAGAQPLLAALLVLPLSALVHARAYAVAVGVGLAVVVPIASLWLVLLARIAPEYFAGWLAWQQASVANPVTVATAVGLAKLIAWSAWPVWPLTLWASWSYRRHLRDPGFAVPFVGTVVTLVLLALAGADREMEALALLVPLAIPAGSAAVALRRGAANALTWFSLMTFSLAAAASWVMWIAMMTGTPERIARNVMKLVPGYVPEFAWLPVVAGAALTTAWLVLVTRCDRSTLRSVPFWTAGVALVWGLGTTTWLAWIDYGKSYAGVGAALVKALPPKVACVESRGLGETQRAAFHYHASLLTLRAEVHGATRCPYLLVQSDARPGSAAEPGREWRRVWEGSRPRDRERYRLYRRVTG